ncbi:hypothetical protein VTJ49DRAFT_710 [Mycothermus thermophilus]|uniref:Uncharacterized protein n=1 Tax=Humicola insolens TaxID=85995 RepID=A0ABR3VFE5_HUMIN
MMRIAHFDSATFFFPSSFRDSFRSILTNPPCSVRLYQAPVESDLPSKPPLDRSARLRSNIRRALDRNEDRIRERRRRVLAAAMTTSSSDAGRRLVRSYVPEPPLLRSMGSSADPRSGSENGRRSLRDTNRRIGLDDHLVTIFGERWAHLHAESNPSPLRNDLESAHNLPMAVESAFLPRHREPRPEPTYALSSIRSTQASDHVSTTSLTESIWRHN